MEGSFCTLRLSKTTTHCHVRTCGSLGVRPVSLGTALLCFRLHVSSEALRNYILGQSEFSPDSSVSGKSNCSFIFKKVPRSPRSMTRIKQGIGLCPWPLPHTSLRDIFPSKHRKAAPTLQLVYTGIHSLFSLMRYCYSIW